MAYMTSKGLDIMRNTVIERKKAQEEYGNKIKFLKVKDGEKKRIRFLVDINEVLNIYYHTIPVSVNGKTRFPKFACTQDESCPACNCEDKDIKKVHYAFRIPVVDLDGEEEEVCIWEGTVTTAQILLDFVDEYETLLGRDFKLSRTGEKLSTKYTLMPALKETEFDISKYEVPEGYDLKVNVEKMKDALKVAEGSKDEEEFNSPC